MHTISKNNNSASKIGSNFKHYQIVMISNIAIAVLHFFILLPI